MHEIQRKLLDLSRHEDISNLSLRKVGEKIGVQHAAQVKHHLDHLVKHGFLVKNAAGRLLSQGLTPGKSAGLVTIPFMGEADCGEATAFASGEIQGYLTISPRLTHRANSQGLYALKAKGDSMNRADIGGNSINDSDYVIVESCNASELKDGDYVVSIMNGLANIKRHFLDNIHQRVVLKSESKGNYPPIIIANDDLQYYQVAGKVVDVIKGTAHLN